MTPTSLASRFLRNLPPCLAVALIAALALVACGASAEPTSESAPAPSEPPSATSAPAPTADSEPAAATESPPPSAKLAPTFELPNAKGETVSLASYAGDKNVVLVFYRGFW